MTLPTRPGMTLPLPGHLHAQRDRLIELADLGYTDVWSAESDGPDAFTPLALAAAWEPRLRLGTAIVPAFTRAPACMAQSVAAMADAAPGRFAFGVGSSSNVIVERWNGVPFTKPLTRVREAVEALRPILAGERGPGGFKLETAPAHPVPIYVAALRDRMLRMAGEHADGTFVNFLPLSGLPHVTEQIREGERRGDREGESEVVCRFFCIPQPPEAGMGVARFLLSAYATVPVYEAFFRSLGWGEALDPMVKAWNEGDRKLALERAPEELIREIVIFGSPEEQRARLEEFAARGITNLVLTPIAGPEDLAELIDALAPVG